MYQLIFGLFLFSAATAALECRPYGSIVPRPHHLACSASLRATLDDLGSKFDAAVSGKIRAGWDIRNASLSIGLVSLDEDLEDGLLWEYHHLAAGNVNGTKQLDRHSQYLIGSISKAISDAAFIKSGVDLDDPITKYLPSLKNNSSLVSWDNITIRALASQLSGIPPNYGFSEYYYLKDLFESLGFPHLNNSDYADCGIIGLNGGCDREDLLKGMLKVHPISPPEDRPVYSNIAFTIIAYAIQEATGMDYPDLIRALISAPLGLTNTLPSPGNDSQAVIPPVQNSWGSNYADATPGGGLVSTLADLAIFTRSILDQTLFGTPTAVLEWLHPRAFTGSPNSFVGMPWEIFRPPPSLIFPGYNTSSGEGGHTITIHAKDGAAYGYHARMAIVDEYGVGLVVLTAGDAGALTSIYDALLGSIIPAVDAAAKEEAQFVGYTGNFATSQRTGNASSTVNASIALDGKSLAFKSLYRNGVDILESLQLVWAATLQMVLPDFPPSKLLRLYPTNIIAQGVRSGQEVILEDWRASFDVALNLTTDLPGRGISDNDCLSWTFMDWIYYGSESVDRVVFVKSASSGEVLGVEIPFLRSGVVRRTTDSNCWPA